MAHHSSSDSDGLSLPTAVAIDRDKHSPYAVRWAIENLLPPNANLLLIHVTNRNSQQHISGVTDGTLDANGGPTEPDLQNVFGSFRLYCARKGVTPKEAVLDDIDISKALLNFISNNFVANIVLGASTRSSLARKFKNHDVPTIINKYAPDFCSVYVIAKGKALSIRPALRPALNSATPPRLPSPRGLPPQLPHDPLDLESAVKAQFIKGGHDTVRTRTFPTNMSMDMDMFSRETKPTSSRTSLADDCDFPTPHNTGSIDMTAQNLDFNPPQETSPPSSSKDVEAEMKRLKLELKQTMDMYNTACKEAVSAKKKAKELHQWKKEEARRFEQSRLAEEAAFAIVEKEKARSKAALEAAEKAQKLAEMEAQRRQYAELKARRETEEKNRALDVLSQNDVRYRKYNIEEIETATDHFSGSLKIGEGGYGPVYRGKLDHTPVAIKVLRPDAKQGRKQFQQEVEILGCIRHPNMVLLLGACPEYGCLVYEFMNYGSLEDRLFRKGNSPPIPWRIRFKIAADIAIGLLFLHQAKPEPLVHRDLKPANILLDRNFVCKISDVGLARLVPPSVANSVTQYHMTSAAGTFCYIDPEYQQTGKLGTKSDIYSLGIVLLQIITARPPMGLTHHVERAIQKGTFADLLDPTVPDWPVEEALQFANLSLKCCELRKKDRPDLGLIILPELNRLRDFGKSKK
ncbi:U-box domain-containing protein 52-like [Actinidia eriantha]|uniref:U-box domain-containing protein 52-like n=1 Tax=Actinidia eriantha TaxID=165200 RepID=UPI00258CA5D8|nr:U-box domain-containing protein 52-like [Actinidia eriantha]